MDIVIIGGGPGGYVAAIYAAKRGANVTLVEKDKLGGTCLNRGCIPTKTILHSANLFHETKRFSDFGIIAEATAISFPRVMQRKDEVTTKLRSGVEYLLNKNKVTVIEGKASLLDAGTVAVQTTKGTKNIQGDAIILAVGTVPSSLPFLHVDGTRIINSDHIMELNALPDSLAVIGGGVIGCEFAQSFARMGSKVTIIEVLPRLIANMDKKQSALLTRVLKADGVSVLLEHSVASVHAENDDVRIMCKDQQGNEKTVHADQLLVAMGRAANTDGLGLERINIATDAKGFIEVDEYLRTNVSNVYAIGDITGKLQLAHVASHQGIVAVKNIFGEREIMRYDVVPLCIYTQPEIASLGITEQDATAYSVRIGEFPAAANGRAVIEGVADGFSKVIVDEAEDIVRGIHLAGPNVTEMISGLAGIIQFEATTEDVDKWIFAHPSVSEMIHESILDADHMGIHK
ncbi:MAG: dihydrolipoyl dehydrogenase [Eubacteriales bacterium]|nr:dihydrolipoyl dehydrogenase [Eubacteriales bacterium]